MTITVEDGSTVAGANSYITFSDYSTWADARFGSGRSTAPADATAAEPFIFRAMDYFEELDFVGYKATSTQALQWPRSWVTIDGNIVSSTSIPDEVKNALFELAYAEETSVGELNTLDRRTSSAKVGDISISYADNSSAKTTSPSIHRALRKLLSGGIGGFKVSRA